MPEACPYVMMQFVRPPIVADINHRICDACLKDYLLYIFFVMHTIFLTKRLYLVSKDFL